MHTKNNNLLTLHYGLTIFLSAFLLFQVQPMIGKMILPWFGGSASVWTTCMLFFQMLLLLGYSYSHFVMEYRSPRFQSYLHISLMALSLIFLPLAANADWRPTGAENPTIRILALLTVSIGLPYFVLSTTGPLIQAWFVREKTNALPYRLFALSNLGSLLALLAYPLLVETSLPTKWQSWSWSILFGCFALCCGSLAWRGRNGEAKHAVHHEPVAKGSPGQSLTWVALAACPSIVMITDTSFLTENVAPVPLLWVVPLALYLLSFILCFEGKSWYQRRIFLPLLVAGIGSMSYLPTLGMNALPVLWAMGINLSSFFVICMVCHGELAALRPHPSRLTGFYLMLAVGGACGGVFVGIIAPYSFNSNYDYSIGLVLTALVVSIVVITKHISAHHKKLAWLLAASLTLTVAYIRADDHRDELSDAKLLVRNFYGSQGVYDADSGPEARRILMHGQIIHGKQYLSPDRAQLPLTYYSFGSGVGRAITTKEKEGPLRIGLVGLGAGTLASYGRAGDTYRIYEIDPLVVDIAHHQFTFLANNPAQTEIYLGDARLTLDRQQSQQFDVLVIDAFSGDSVPVHLLTKEAFQIYFRHLKPDGVLALHVTNRFLDLPPVVKAEGESFGKTVRMVKNEGDRSHEIYSAAWTLISNDSQFFARDGLKEVAEEIPSRPGLRLWTDDYSSVFSVLK
ncbi:SAM-dependent methyltransferase [Oxalobacteraceae bacterium GrIS 2.11]